MTTSNKAIHLLNDLIQLDIDAIRAYEQALDAVKDNDVRRNLLAFRGDHERHVNELSGLVRGMGGTPPAFKPDLKGFLIEGMTAVRALAGENAALSAMRDNERLTNNRYQAALDNPNLPANCRDVVARNREDERRHLAYIESRVRAKAPA